jgi:hypothetical protein
MKALLPRCVYPSPSPYNCTDRKKKKKKGPTGATGRYLEHHEVRRTVLAIAIAPNRTSGEAERPQPEARPDRQLQPAVRDTERLQ